MIDVNLGITVLKSALGFLASCIAQNKIDDLIEAVESSLDETDQVAVQFYQALDEAYKRTCEAYGWEYSPSAIKDYFSANEETGSEIPVDNNFAAILRYVTGEGYDIQGSRINLVTEDAVKYWKEALDRAVSTRPSLTRYFLLKRSEDRSGGSGGVTGDSRSEMRDTIRFGIIPPCKTYVDGQQRRKDLEDLEKVFLETRQAIWLHGESGIGKTQLMLRFAQLHPEYKYVFVKYRSSIQQTVSQNLFHLRGFESRGRELTDIVRYERNLEAFASYGNELVLLIDDVDPDDYEEAFFEETKDYLGTESMHLGKTDAFCINELLRQGIHMILSTKMIPPMSDSYHMLKIGDMDEDALLQVMLNNFPAIQPFLDQKNIQMLKEMIGTAERNTVILSVMAGAMQASGGTPEASLKELYDSILDPRMETLPQGTYHMGYTGDIGSMAWHMEKIFRFMELGWSEKEVLRMAAMLPPEEMDYELYKKIISSSAVQLNQMREEIIRKFGKINLVSFQGEGRNTTVRMHALTARYTLWALQRGSNVPLSKEVHINWTSKLLSYFSDEKLEKLNPSDGDFKDIAKIARLCMGTESRLEREESGFHDRYQLQLKAAELYLKIGDVKNALECTERAITVDGASSADTREYLLGLCRIGNILLKVGKYRESLSYYQQASRVLEYKYGNLEEMSAEEAVETIDDEWDQRNYAAICDQIGYIYRELGDHQRALEYKVKALEIKKKVLPETHPDLAKSYNNLGMTYGDLGDHQRALKYIVKALEIWKKVLPETHPTLAICYNNVGVIYVKLGDPQLALEYIEKALEIRKKVLPETHPTLAISYDTVGTAYGELGDHQRALEYKVKALEIAKKVLPETHPDLAASYNNVGTTYVKLGDHQRALEYQMKALEIRKKVLPETHLDLAVSYNNVGITYEDMGDHQRALEYQMKALEIRKKVLPETHLDLAISYYNVGVTYGKLGDHQRALEYQVKGLEIYKKVLPETHPDLATIYNNVGTTYGDLGDHQREQEYKEKAQELLRKRRNS